MQFSLPPAPRLVLGQLMAGTGPAGAVNVSATLMLVTVTLPVFFTAKVYDTD